MEWDDIAGEAQSRTWESLEELNAWLAKKTRAYNTAPQARLSGLSPEQAARLFGDDWEGDGPLRLNWEVFGLVESREIERREHFLARYAYRVSDLFGRFIRSDFG